MTNEKSFNLKCNKTRKKVDVLHEALAPPLQKPPTFLQNKDITIKQTNKVLFLQGLFYILCSEDMVCINFL